MCRYGPDGKVQKTPVVEPPPPEKKRGLKGKIVAKKTGEMKEELEAAVALVQQYVPPSPDLMQVVMNAGTASLAQAGPGFAGAEVPRLRQAGRRADADLRLRREDAAPDRRQHLARQAGQRRCTLKVTMQALPDGTSYPGNIVLSIPTAQHRGPDHEVELPEDCAVTER